MRLNIHFLKHISHIIKCFHKELLQKIALYSKLIRNTFFLKKYTVVYKKSLFNMHNSFFYLYKNESTVFNFFKNKICTN